MNTFRQITLGILIGPCFLMTCSFACAQALPCGLETSAATSPFANVSGKGTVEYTSRLAKIPLGENLELPFNLHFKAEDPSGSLILGNHWFFGPIDSKIMKTSEDNISMISPTGQLLDFKKSGSIWHAGQWILEVSNDRARVQSPCGISLIYDQGRFTRLLKNEKILLEVLRNTNSGQFEIVTPQIKICVNPTSNGFEVENLDVKKFQIHFDPTEKDRQFDFVCSNKSVKLNFENEVSVLRTSDENSPEEITRLHSGDLKVISHDDWVYTSKPVDSAFKLTRRSINNPTVYESWYENRDIGLKITDDDKFGELHYKKFVSGINAGSLRSVSKIEKDKEVWLQQHYYDDKGRKLRSLMGSDTEEEVYDDINRSHIHKLNGEFIWEKKSDEKGRIIAFTDSKKNTVEITYDSTGKQNYKIKKQ